MAHEILRVARQGSRAAARAGGLILVRLRTRSDAAFYLGRTDLSPPVLSDSSTNTGEEFVPEELYNNWGRNATGNFSTRMTAKLHLRPVHAGVQGRENGNY